MDKDAYWFLLAKGLAPSLVDWICCAPDQVGRVEITAEAMEMKLSFVFSTSRPYVDR